MPKLKTNEQFLEDCKKYRPVDYMEYIFLESYKGTNKKIYVRHLKCGTEYEIKPSTFLFNKTSCKKCQSEVQKEKCREIGSSNRLNHFQYLKKFNNESKGKYMLLSEYIDSKHKISIQCLNCGNIYSVLPTTFQHGYRCRNCSSKNRSTVLTFEKFINKVKEKRDDFSDYEFLNFKEANAPLTIKHKCGFIYTISRAKKFLDKPYHGCRKCASAKESFPTIKIRNYLESYGYDDIDNADTISKYFYVREGKIDGCKNKRHLCFDFILTDKNKNILSIIECDGPQHREPIYGDKKFESTQKRDKIKNEFCKKKRIFHY